METKIKQVKLEYGYAVLTSELQFCERAVWQEDGEEVCGRCYAARAEIEGMEKKEIEVMFPLNEEGGFNRYIYVVAVDGQAFFDTL